MDSNNIAIKVEKISKCYRIGLKEEMHDTIAKSILNFIKSPLKNYRKYRSLYRFDDVYNNSGFNSDLSPSDIIWALKNFSIEIKQGESVGIIGRNGSGKSTLLKILSRITAPTSGYARIHGRVSSLLEVGTGFHPELTGRENVYLNGTVLGMRKKEIDHKFDEIVDYSGVGRFIDTPVKRYSSGMNVRLAFSVAAHLEPEILMVDEVLAVGDAEFQMKCMGTMSNVAKEGRTVLFVSHNMGAIIELCSRVLWIEGGCLKLDGHPQDVVTKYLSSSGHVTGSWTRSPAEEHAGRLAWLKHARVLSGNEDKVSTLVHYDEQVKIEIGYEIKSKVKAFKIYLLLRDSLGNIVWASHDTDETDNKVDQVREPGIYNSTCVFPERLLRPGQYSVTFGINGKPRDAVLEEHSDVVSFSISQVGYTFNRNRKGLITPCLAWEVERQKEDETQIVG